MQKSKFFGGGESESEESEQEDQQEQEVQTNKTTNRFARAAGLLGAPQTLRLQALCASACVFVALAAGRAVIHAVVAR